MVTGSAVVQVIFGSCCMMWVGMAGLVGAGIDPLLHPRPAKAVLQPLGARCEIRLIH